MMNGMPLRSQQAIDALLGMLSDRVKPEFEALLRQLDVELARLGDRDDDLEVFEASVRSRRALALQSGRFHPAFMASLRWRAMEAWSHEPPAPGRVKFPERLQPLRLLDEHIVDEDAVLAGIAARLESAASLALLLLGQRFGVLLERPPLAAAALPVGPVAFGRAMQDAGQDIGLGLRARMALYGLAEPVLTARYPVLAEGMDAVLDNAGILPGLSYVPLRPRDGRRHPDRGKPPPFEADPAPGDAPLSETAALRVVNGVLDDLVPEGVLPERGLEARREAVAALVRFLLVHGPESPPWQRGVDAIREVVAAAREGRTPDAGTLAWMREQLATMDYAAADIEPLVAGLASIGMPQDPDDSATEGAAPVSPGISAAAASARERRWQERLEQLPLGSTIGFTAAGGIVRANLRQRSGAQGVLLANEDNGHQAWVDAPTMARMLAGGEAWIVRGRGERT